MSWSLSDKEMLSVLAREPEVRFRYMVSRVVDQSILWGWVLDDTSWLLMSDDAGAELVPVWPHERYATRVAEALGLHGEPAPIELDEWLEAWLPAMQTEGRLVAVFPDENGTGVVMPPSELETALREALSRIE